MNKIAPLVSVIIPIYNGEKYIERCLNSVKQQKNMLLEVVAVNDGSTDQSLELLEEYRRRNKEELSIVIVNQKNAGQGQARNTGIQHSSGEFIVFLDQDDTLAEDVFSIMLQDIIEKKADIIIGGYQRVTENGKIKRTVKLKQTEWARYQVVAPWGKIYRSKFLKEHNIKFMQTVLGEDIFFMISEYVHFPKVIISDLICYHWTDNEKSVSNTIHKKISGETSVLHLFHELERIPGMSELKKDKMYEYFLLKTAVWDILYTAAQNVYEDVARNNREIWTWMGKHYPDYAKNPYLAFHKPAGEKIWIRAAVCIYIKSRNTRIHTAIMKMVSRAKM